MTTLEREFALFVLSDTVVSGNKSLNCVAAFANTSVCSRCELASMHIFVAIATFDVRNGICHFAGRVALDAIWTYVFPC